MKGVYDTKGNEWVVAKGDMAYDRVHKLQSAGYEYIILPVRSLIGLPVNETDRGNADVVGATADIRVLRQADCMDWLERNYGTDENIHTESRDDNKVGE